MRGEKPPLTSPHYSPADGKLTKIKERRKGGNQQKSKREGDQEKKKCTPLSSSLILVSHSRCRFDSSLFLSSLFPIPFHSSLYLSLSLLLVVRKKSVKDFGERGFLPFPSHSRIRSGPTIFILFFIPICKWSIYFFCNVVVMASFYKKIGFLCIFLASLTFLSSRMPCIFLKNIKFIFFI